MGALSPRTIPKGPYGAFASLLLLPGSWPYRLQEFCLFGWVCRVAHLPREPVVAALPGSSPTRQNCSLALATSLFTKRQPNWRNFEGTYTSERFLTSRSVKRGRWVYKRGSWELGEGWLGRAARGEGWRG